MDPVTWIYIAIVLISAAYAYQNRPKVTAPRPAAFEEFEFPQFKEGTPQAVIFGDCWDTDWMVIGLGNFRHTRIRTDSGK